MGTWEHEQIFQGNLGTKWILGSNLEFLLGEQLKNIFGNKGDFGDFSREHGNTEPLWRGQSKESSLLDIERAPQNGHSCYFAEKSRVQPDSHYPLSCAPGTKINCMVHKSKKFPVSFNDIGQNLQLQRKQTLT